MKHKRFEENILIDEAYTKYERADKNADHKKGHGIAKHFAETLQYEERLKWYEQLPHESDRGGTESALHVEELRKEAAAAMHGDTLAYETKCSKRGGGSEQQWARTLLSKGSIGDRVAAATILIQEDPVHNLNALRSLISNVKPAKKKDAIVIIDALSELLMSDLLIPDTKLRKFEQHPLTHLDEVCSGNKHKRRQILKLWYYEDELKRLYEVYVQALNSFGHDSVESNREKAVTAMSYLLMHHPEREKELLSHIINKLGDSSGSVCSKVIYNLCQLLYHHPNMKQVLLKEMHLMLFRTNISARAQHYGICLLNQFHLHRDDATVADTLVHIYFAFFKANIKKGDIDTRLMSAILSGVKRALPYCTNTLEGESAPWAAHVSALHKIIHMASAGVAVQALSLLQLIAATAPHMADRYHRALYRKLLAPSLLRGAHAAQCCALLLRTVSADECAERRVALRKRVLHMCVYNEPHAIAALQVVIAHTLRKHAHDALVMHTHVTQRDPEEEHTHDGKQPPKENTDLLHGTKQDLLTDDEELYVDMRIDSGGNVKAKRRVAADAVAGSWHHRRLASTQTPISDSIEDTPKPLEAAIVAKKTLNMDKRIHKYEPLSRNPAFSGAEHAVSAELHLLANHYHPTVKLFAQQLLRGEPIEYNGDPLIDFSGVRFLDRFVFKNPKRRSEHTTTPADDNVNKVRGSHPKFALRKNYTARGIRGVRVTSSAYLNETAARIPADEKFLYDYLRGRRCTHDHDHDSDNDSVSSEQFNEYLDSITRTHAPDDSDEELDYLADMNKHADVDDDDEEDDADDDDEEDDADDDEDGVLDMKDEEEMALDEEDEEDVVDVPAAAEHKRKLKGSLGALFANAEEFSTLLEENGDGVQGSSGARSNKEGASKHQLAWEERRDKWIAGYNTTILGNRKRKQRREPPPHKKHKKH